MIPFKKTKLPFISPLSAPIIKKRIDTRLHPPRSHSAFLVSTSRYHSASKIPAWVPLNGTPCAIVRVSFSAIAIIEQDCNLYPSVSKLVILRRSYLYVSYRTALNVNVSGPKATGGTSSLTSPNLWLFPFTWQLSIRRKEKVSEENNVFWNKRGHGFDYDPR